MVYAQNPLTVDDKLVEVLHRLGRPPGLGQEPGEFRTGVEPSGAVRDQDPRLGVDHLQIKVDRLIEPSRLHVSVGERSSGPERAWVVGVGAQVPLGLIEVLAGAEDCFKITRHSRQPARS